MDLCLENLGSDESVAKMASLPTTTFISRLIDMPYETDRTLQRLGFHSQRNRILQGVFWKGGEDGLFVEVYHQGRLTLCMTRNLPAALT